MRGVTDTGRRAAAPRRVLAALCAALALWPAAVAAQRPDAGPAPRAGGAAAGKAPAAAGGEAAKPAGPPQLDARAWILVDPRDGEVLAAEAPNKQRAIASATKLMTAYVALRKLSPGRFLRAAPYAAGAAESLLGLRTGERMRVRDLLYGLILASGERRRGDDRDGHGRVGPALRRDDEPAGCGARSRQHGLLEPGRPR